MQSYVRALSRELGRRDLAVDVFTRRVDPALPPSCHLGRTLVSSTSAPAIPPRRQKDGVRSLTRVCLQSRAVPPKREPRVSACAQSLLAERGSERTLTPLGHPHVAMFIRSNGSRTAPCRRPTTVRSGRMSRPESFRRPIELSRRASTNDNPWLSCTAPARARERLCRAASISSYSDRLTRTRPKLSLDCPAM